MATAEQLSQVRALISDTTQEDYDSTGVLRYILSDDTLNAMIDLRDGGVYGASADALRAMAANEIIIGKVIRTQDLQTNGAQVGDALRLLAREYDKRQNDDDDNAALNEFAFEIVNFEYPYRNPEDDWLL